MPNPESPGKFNKQNKEILSLNKKEKKVFVVYFLCAFSKYDQAYYSYCNNYGDYSYYVVNHEI